MKRLLARLSLPTSLRHRLLRHELGPQGRAWLEGNKPLEELAQGQFEISLWVSRQKEARRLHDLLDLAGDSDWAHQLVARHLSFPAPRPLLERTLQHSPHNLATYLLDRRVSAEDIRWMFQETMNELRTLAAVPRAERDPGMSIRVVTLEERLRQLGDVFKEEPSDLVLDLLSCVQSEGTPLSEEARDLSEWSRDALEFWALSDAHFAEVHRQLGPLDPLTLSFATDRSPQHERLPEIFQAMIEAEHFELEMVAEEYLSQHAVEEQNPRVREVLSTSHNGPILETLFCTAREAQEKERLFHRLLVSGPRQAARLVAEGRHPLESLSREDLAQLLAHAGAESRLELIRHMSAHAADTPAAAPSLPAAGPLATASRGRSR